MRSGRKKSPATQETSLLIAIAGRPNVGKSTLFNRLTGKRKALVDDRPGVTRDVREGKAKLSDLSFRLFDTAGLEEADSESLSGRMTKGAQDAMKQADAVLFLLDGREGVTPTDEHFARGLRKIGKPVIVLVNKAEGTKATNTIAEAYKLGFGEPIAISAEHGEGMVELYDALKSSCEEHSACAGSPAARDPVLAANAAPQHDATAPLQIAIVGRPNAGKSTLFNRILGRERSLTGPEAGITRDAILVECEFQGQRLRLVDTAGMRRKAGITDKVERLAVADAIDSLQLAQIVALVIDAEHPLEKQDNAIAALVEREGRALVIAVNKWDKIDKPDAYMKAIEERLASVLPQVSGVAVVPISAKTGFQVPKLINTCLKVYKLWNTEIPTGTLNRWLEAALDKHTPPLINGRRLKIRYATQKSARPPTFLLFTNLSDVPDHYMRYLLNELRADFDLPGIPIRLKLRKNKNPYSAGE